MPNTIGTSIAIDGSPVGVEMNPGNGNPFVCVDLNTSQFPRAYFWPSTAIADGDRNEALTQWFENVAAEIRRCVADYAITEADRGPYRCPRCDGWTKAEEGPCKKCAAEVVSA